ncbi:aspartate aminotransferase [Flexibacter flexilis DSM 6793]|uniref:Aminotransferase n=1 Tax=Flexibacter flexilis DSM 6793 TaxID=927664 RepID=A0A1I1DQY3_9BACT|nr:pyridoxal phosphate-dependent aminotransferase [Flexibacter flexilis]SFB77217.1 aspartate aminotransferase [Flexibacter flexilis DSM 6793]
MTHFLSERINAMSESQTIAMAKKARELAAQGFDVINLSFGEPDFQTPDYIKAAAKKAIDDGFSFYTPVPGYLDLRQAIAEKLLRDNGLSYKPENIVVSTGAKQSIANAVMCLVNPSDEVVIIAPYWVSYLEIVKLAEGEPVIVSGTLENDFKPTAAQIEAAITPKTKLLMYSSPSNPTGAMFSREELAAIADVLERHPHVLVIADEIYEYINFEGKHESLASFEKIKDRVVTVNGFSKGFAMTGWRVGYIAAAKPIADACDKMQGQFTSGTCSIAQKAALGALKGDMTPTKEMTAAFLRRRDMMVGLLSEIEGFKISIPKGAFYLFPDISHYFGKKNGEQTITNAADLSMYLLNEAHVSLVTGEAFGDENCIRISFAAADEKLREAVSRIKAALAKLQ